MFLFVSFSLKYFCMFLREFYVLQFVPLCCHWAPVTRVWLCSLYFPPMRHLYTLIRSHWPWSSPLWTIIALSASPHMRDAPVLECSWKLLAGLDPVNPCLMNWGGKPAGKTGNLVHSTLVLDEVHVFYYSSTAHTCRLYRLMKLQENQIIFQSAVRMKEMLFSSWRSLYYPMKLWKVSSAK